MNSLKSASFMYKNELVTLMTKAKSWSFDDHAKYIKNLKRKCKDLMCLQSILEMYHEARAVINKELWEKCIQVINELIKSFRHSTKNVDLQSRNLGNNTEQRKAPNNISIYFESIPEILRKVEFHLFNLKGKLKRFNHTRVTQH